jgi:hypothetical protein
VTCNEWLVGTIVIGMDMTNVDGADGHTGSTHAEAWHTANLTEVMGRRTIGRSITTGAMRIAQLGALTVASYSSVVHPVFLGIGKRLILDMTCTFRTKVIAPLT